MSPMRFGELSNEVVVALLARSEEAVRRITLGHGAMRIPADPTDPDLVLGEWIAFGRRLLEERSYAPPRVAVVQQQTPATNESSGPEVWPLVFADLDGYGKLPAWLRDDMRARHEMGVAKYGTALHVWNGRDAAVDAYQEALDLCVYLRQCFERVARPDPDHLSRPSLGLSWSLDRALRLAHGLGELVRAKAVPVQPPKGGAP